MEHNADNYLSYSERSRILNVCLHISLAGVDAMTNSPLVITTGTNDMSLTGDKALKSVEAAKEFAAQNGWALQPMLPRQQKKDEHYDQ